jgi:hypothetical protein
MDRAGYTDNDQVSTGAWTRFRRRSAAKQPADRHDIVLSVILQSRQTRGLKLAYLEAVIDSATDRWYVQAVWRAMGVRGT